MQWIHDYDLFLFDFDGLLVNTEEVHYQAYRKMCADRGYNLDWDFWRYIQIAHYSSEGLEKQIYAQFPELKKQEPNWSVLYGEKRDRLIEMYNKGDVEMMPGAEALLTALREADIPRCVVTHSSLDLVHALRNQHEILNTIPYWITRYDYNQPKPHPECYIKAVDKYADNGDRVIGFEDTPRGLHALMGTRAKPVMVAPLDYPEIEELQRQGVVRYRSFLDIPEDHLG
ncbi:MAG: HAD family phosphatase [Chlamydiales bacterium]|nr:HAD family phosphatase [Chlamydiia bacterium]MCP5508561.1 HAD family phosphatase [Chlamydiales bacterium]